MSHHLPSLPQSILRPPFPIIGLHFKSLAHRLPRVQHILDDMNLPHVPLPSSCLPPIRWTPSYRHYLPRSSDHSHIKLTVLLLFPAWPTPPLLLHLTPSRHIHHHPRSYTRTITIRLSPPTPIRHHKHTHSRLHPLNHLFMFRRHLLGRLIHMSRPLLVFRDRHRCQL